MPAYRVYMLRTLGILLVLLCVRVRSFLDKDGCLVPGGSADVGKAAGVDQSFSFRGEGGFRICRRGNWSCASGPLDRSSFGFLYKVISDPSKGGVLLHVPCNSAF